MTRIANARKFALEKRALSRCGRLPHLSADFGEGWAQVIIRAVCATVEERLPSTSLRASFYSRVRVREKITPFRAPGLKPVRTNTTLYAAINGRSSTVLPKAKIRQGFSLAIPARDLNTRQFGATTLAHASQRLRLWARHSSSRDASRLKP